MRPKKVVLIVDPDPDRMGVSMMVLSIKKFAVAGVNTQEQMDEFLTKTYPDAILFNTPGNYRADSLDEHQIPFMTRTGAMPWSEVLMRLRVMTSRKRGPKKGAYISVNGKLVPKPPAASSTNL